MTRPLFASAATAAKLLDMKPSQFRTLVAEGVLPRPVEIGGETRWPAASLEALARMIAKYAGKARQAMRARQAREKRR